MGLRGKFETRREKILLAVIIVLLLVAVLIGTNAYLYLRFLLGNDVVVDLSASDHDLFLLNGESATLTYTASIATNPFCKTACEMEFEDVSSNAILRSEEFALRPGLPATYSFPVHAPEYGEGQRLYRYRLSCRGVDTLFCHTAGNPTERVALTTLNYHPGPGELLAKERTGKLLPETATLLGDLFTKTGLIRALERELANRSAFEPASLPDDVSSQRARLLLAEEAWNASRFGDALAETLAARDRLEVAGEVLDQAERRVREAQGSYNALLQLLDETGMLLDSLALLPSESDVRMAERTIELYIAAANLFEASPQESEQAIHSLVMQVRNETRSLAHRRDIAALNLTLQADIAAETACMAGMACIPHPSPEARLSGNLSLAGACEWHSRVLDAFLTGGNVSLEEAESAQEAFANTSREYLSLAQGETALVIKSLIPAGGNVSGGNFSTDALARLMPGCSPIPISHTLPALPDPIQAEVPATFRNVSLIDPPQQCCLWGECVPCCTSADCISVPVVLLHGHAFNKDLSAEYSLDAFNDLQALLEDEGYLNAGAITSYTGSSSAPGVWGKIPSPVSVKASYYFDVFQKRENYIVVQIKSESIDTYAVRLQEVLDAISERTGSEEVVVVAHSMGGLVARRYMQIDRQHRISKLIMIGTPNHGVTDDVAEYCGVIGEQLECRDLREGSLFLNKLNRQPLPTIPIINIVGSGCEMASGDGDGIVLGRNALLSGAENRIVKGSCRGRILLHTQLLNMDVHPEVGELILDSLE